MVYCHVNFGQSLAQGKNRPDIEFLLGCVRRSIMKMSSWFEKWNGLEGKAYKFQTYCLISKTFGFFKTFLTAWHIEMLTLTIINVFF